MWISQILNTIPKQNELYDLAAIYDIVARNANKQRLNSSPDWKHVVRGVLSSRKVGGRKIIYHGQSIYSFT